MKRPLILTLAAGAALLCAGAAHAGNVQWSVGINLPPVATVISGGPGYYPGPVPLYRPVPAPVYYSEPAPVYYPQPEAYAPQVVYEAPAVVYRAPYVGYRDVRPIVYAPRVWDRPYHRDWRPAPYVRGGAVYREERRHHHDERADYRY